MPKGLNITYKPLDEDHVWAIMTWAEQDVGGGHLTVEVAVRNMKAAPKPLGRFSHTWKSHRRDRTGWLGRQDSNLGMTESKSTCSAFDFNDHPEKSANFDSFPSNRLGADSECAARRAQAFWCFLITHAFAVIMFLTAWHGPDCRSPQRSISIGGAVLMAGCGSAP